MAEANAAKKQPGIKANKTIKTNAVPEVKIPETKKISLWLDDYGDIFSDFDPRPFSLRALSDDFLREAEKMYKEKKPGKFELRILMPLAERNLKTEGIIKKRLKSFFKSKSGEIGKQIRGVKKKGIVLVFLGLIAMFFATLLAHSQRESFLLLFLIIVSEPAGWFAVWYGLDKIFYEAFGRRGHYNFYEKISRADIIFDSY